MEILMNENSYKGALYYFKRKTIQLSIEGFRLINTEEVSNIGVVSSYLKNNQEYHIFYLYKYLRGKGIYEKVVKKYNWTIIVSNPIYYKYFKKKKINYIPLSGFTKTKEYLLACNYYKKEKDYNGIPLIYKLDMRLYIMRSLGASNKAMKAMCIDQTLTLPLTNYGSNDIIRLLKKYRIVKEIVSLGDILKLNHPSDDVKKMVVSNEIQKNIIEDSISKKEETKTELYKCILCFGFNTKIYNNYKSQLQLI